MEPKTILRVAMILSVSAAVAGCLDPGRIDPTVLYRYQRYTAGRGPQERRGDDLLRPSPGSTGEPLKSVKDPQTGRTRVELTLTEAVHRTLRNNVTINIAGYDPAIAREEVVTAAAAFDATVFASLSLDRVDRRTTSSFQTNMSKTVPFQVGVRKRLETGGEASLTYDFTRSDSTFNNLLNPSYTHSAAFELTHPLLRDAGPEVALASLRVARVNHEISLAVFRTTVLDIVDQVQGLYWQLGRARDEVAIQQALLDRTIETQQKVAGRTDIDAHKVLQAQAAAAVAVRHAGLIRARKSVMDVQDRLVRAMADASVTVLDEYEIIPVTPPVAAKVTVDAADQVAAALKYSPEMAQTRLAIRVNDINVKVARNQILPRLDLTGRVGWNGLGRHWDNGWNEMNDWNYIDYTVGLAFEWPIGNRERQAMLRRARLGRAKSVATMQDTADQVAIAVRDAVRQIDTSFHELQADLKALKANVEKLDALEARQVISGWTPEYFNLRLDAQREIAAAESAALQAKVDLNIVLSRLARVTGTSLPAMGVLVTDAGEIEDIVGTLTDGAKLTGQVDRDAVPEK